MSIKTKISKQSRSKTFKTQHTFASNDDMGQIVQEQIQLNNLSKQKHQNYDQQFQQIYQQIISHVYFNKVSKHEKIRINKWLTKLVNISTNDLWKKNRNNYIKLIRLMFDCQIVIAPFQMMPPDRDLHKLTNHQINVIINQIQKIVNQKQQKNGQKSTNRADKTNTILWTQQSAYINHQVPSQRFKETQNQCKRTFQSSSISINHSKFSESHVLGLTLPPRHPSTTKNNSTNKNTQSQSYFIKQSKVKEDEGYLIRSRQRQRTFQNQQQNNSQYFRQMKHSSLQRNPSVLQKENYDINEQKLDYQYEQKTRQVLNILKCGFKLLEKIPRENLKEKSQPEISRMAELLFQNEILKGNLQKQNVIIQSLLRQNSEFSNFSNRNNELNETSKINDTSKFNETQKINETQKTRVNQKKKMKLTLLSQPLNKC